VCSVSSGASGAISITSGFRRLARTDPIRRVLCKYEQRFSLLLSSSLSPERIDESVLRESPLVHEHTGSDGVGHTSCDTGALIVVVCRRTDCRHSPNLCGTGGTLHKVKRLQVCSRRNLRLAKTHLQTVRACVLSSDIQTAHALHECTFFAPRQQVQPGSAKASADSLICGQECLWLLGSSRSGGYRRKFRFRSPGIHDMGELRE
jgi:hypothetical protein